MNVFLGFCAVAGASLTAMGQSAGPPKWTWMAGNQVPAIPATTQNCATVVAPATVYYCGSFGVYGTMGTAAAANQPGSRFAAASWTDASGNLWLFGGWGFDDGKSAADLKSADEGDLNDLWEYQPSSGQWTWVGGSSSANQHGVYGTLGTAAKGNIPPPRDGASTWVDKTGGLWLFGGESNDIPGSSSSNPGYLNDLWEFDPTTTEWTWVGGSNTSDAPGVYGTQGTAAAGNVPGARTGAASWTDASGNFWLFSGIDLPNDLWMYSPAKNEWTWVGGGSPANGFGYGVYGTPGTPAAANFPGNRGGASTWTDAKGNLWLFGGIGSPGSGANYDPSFWYDDLWEYFPAKNEWAFLTGLEVTSGQYSIEGGEYGTLGVASNGNLPGSRQNAVSWTDKNGNLWLFGGTGSDSAEDLWGSSAVQGQLDDVWEFDVSENQWIWMGGYPIIPNPLFFTTEPYDGQPGNYGQLGVAAVENIPSGRQGPSGWTDANGNGWVFGGMLVWPGVQNYDLMLNDLWKAAPTSGPPVVTPTPTLTVATTSTPGLSTVTISDADPNATIYCTDAANATLNFGLAPCSAGTPYPEGPYYPGDNPGSSSGSNAVITFQAMAFEVNEQLSATASATVTVPLQTFTLAVSPSSLTVAPGGSVKATVTVTPQSEYNQPIGFTCWNLPIAATCTFSPDKLTPSGTGPATAQVTVSVPASSASLRPERSNPLWPGAALAALAGCLGWKRRKNWLMALLACVSLAGLGLLNGCGGSSPSPSSKSYTFELIGQTNSYLVQTNFTVTVTP